MTKLEWNGTFNNDKKQVEEVYNEIDSIMGDINKLFAEAKSYWVDDNDTKGKQFKTDCETSFGEVQANITRAREGKENLFNALDQTMKEINDETR